MHGTTWGYYQIKLRKSGIPFTAFSTLDGLFEHLVTPVGLNGSPGTLFQLSQEGFRDLRELMRIYFDDIYVFTQSKGVADHVTTRDRVLKRCEDVKVQILHG